MRKQVNIVLRIIEEGFINPLFFVLLISIPCISQDSNSYFQDLYNFNHHKLDRNLTYASQEDQIFYKNKIVFINILFNEAPISESIINHYEKSIEDLEELTFKKPQLKGYYIGEAQLILSLIHVKFGNQMSSAKYFIKAYGAFEKNIRNYPELKDPEIAMKFMEISASILPKSLQWITSWFGVESNKEQAIEALRSLYFSNELSPLAKTQCYALNLYLKLQFDIDVLRESSNLNFVVFDILLAEIYGKQKAFDLMIESLERIPDHISIKHFLLGKSYFITEHPDSKKTLEKFILAAKTTNNISAAYFYLYQLDILHQENGLTNRTLVLKQYPQQNFRDKWAKSELKNAQSTEFIRLRNAFDRGDYNTCIKLTALKPNLNIKERYYLANSYIELKQINQAKAQYKILVKQGLKNQYYVPKTGLNLSLLVYKYEPSLAQSILKELKSYKNYPYEKEIEAKSELLLKTL